MSVLIELVLQLLKSLPKEIYIIGASLLAGAGFVIYLNRKERKLTEEHNKQIEEGKKLLVEQEKDRIEDILKDLNDSFQTKLSKGLKSEDVKNLLKDRGKN